MQALILGVSKRDAMTFAAQHLIGDYVWISPRSMDRCRGITVRAVYATDNARNDPDYQAMLDEAEIARLGADRAS